VSHIVGRPHKGGGNRELVIQARDPDASDRFCNRLQENSLIVTKSRTFVHILIIVAYS
jgi:hypothetical protein